MELLCKETPTAQMDGVEITKYVRIFHPSDCVAGNEFLALPALDVFVSSSNSNERVQDVYHHQLALDICQIVAGNQSGYFTSLKNNNSPIPNTIQWLEGSKDYVFHLDSGDTKYSVIVEFSSWKYPPTLPESWKSITENMSRNLPCQCSKSEASVTVLHRDRYCRVCAQQHGLTSAHLIPVSEHNWFVLNSMMDHCYNSENGIHDVANQFGMRMDLRILGLDLGEFSIVVKTGRAVIHFLQAGPGPVVRNELIPLYHNSLFDTDGLAIPFIYSRFAWSIFYKGIIRLRPRQQFLVEGRGVLQSVMSYLNVFEMKEQDDEWNTFRVSEDCRSEDEGNVSEGLEERPTTNTQAVTLHQEKCIHLENT